MQASIVIEICAVVAIIALIGGVFWTMGKEIYREIKRRVKLDEINELKRKEGEELSKAPAGERERPLAHRIE